MFLLTYAHCSDDYMTSHNVDTIIIEMIYADFNFIHLNQLVYMINCFLNWYIVVKYSVYAGSEKVYLNWLKEFNNECYGHTF